MCYEMLHYAIIKLILSEHRQNTDAHTNTCAHDVLEDHARAVKQECDCIWESCSNEGELVTVMIQNWCHLFT